MRRRRTVKVVMKESVLNGVRESKLSGDELSRQMRERARRILNDEPVESVALRINFY